MSFPSVHLAPFTHPRRDAYLARARVLAAAILSLLQAAWFLSFVVAIEGGAKLTVELSLLGLAGIFLVAGRAGETAELSLALVDRLSRLETAPRYGDIFRRLMLCIVFPAVFLVFGFMHRDDSTLIIGAIAMTIAMELIFRFGGVAVWKTAQIHFPTLKSLLSGSLDEAVNLATESAASLSDADLEATVLAVAGVCIREEKPEVLGRLEQRLIKLRDSGSAGARRDVLDRVIAVVCADHARLVRDDMAAVREAEALRLVPAGHPRRLALGLFVATEALEQEDPASALKALRLLHSRDVVISSARVLVDWLMMKAADAVEDGDTGRACRRALKTFDIARALRELDIEQLNGQPGAYAKWIGLAHADLKRLSNAPGELGV